jgi:hypothetical protein
MVKLLNLLLVWPPRCAGQASLQSEDWLSHAILINETNGVLAAACVNLILRSHRKLRECGEKSFEE